MSKKIIYILAATLAIVGCAPQAKKTQKQEQNVSKQGQAEAKPSHSTDGKTSYLTTADFKQKVMDYEAHPQEWVFMGNRPAVIDFYATWCGPCKMMSPIMEQLAQQYGGKIDFYKVDIDKEPELAAVFGIQSIPTFLFIPLKGTPSMQMGMMEKEKMEKILGTLK